MDQDKFRQYLHSFDRYPRLTKEEETDLALRAKAGDKRAKERLFQCSLRWAAQVAHLYGRPRRVPLEDAFSAACEGMTYALTKFDPALGRFSTYSVTWMKCMIGRYERTDDAFAPPRNAKFAKFRIRYTRSLGKVEGELREDVARRVGREVGARESSAILWADAIDAEVSSLDCEIVAGEKPVTLHDLVAQESFDSPETAASRREDVARVKYAVQSALRAVSKRDRMVLERCEMRDDADTLQAVGNDIGVSRERVRQIRNQAMARVGAVLKKRRAA